MTLASEVDPADVARLLAESDVAKVILRYAHGLDRRDFAMVWACFAPDAYVKGSQFEGPLDTYLPRLLDGVASFARTMHFMGNQLREVDGDRARTETYAVAFHFPHADSNDDPMIVGVRYLDELTRRSDGRWVISAREAVGDWTHPAHVRAASRHSE